jgi:Xaa-Pro aminopeptidase
MMHYEATPEKFSKCEPHGFLLVDSGGTYKDGTTDVTRSISLGEPTELEKKYYTLVLKGHLDLELAHFLQGTIGNNLDILARRPLWNIGIDYQCGTGHGVGHVLSVHEGPHGIRWGRSRTNSPAEVLVPGMIVTDEPGIYLPHELGIRIENDLLVVKDVNNFYGQFLKFEAMTLVPYDRESIDVRLLDDTELEAINAYHAVVYEKISPLVEGKVKTWLRQATEPITR